MDSKGTQGGGMVKQGKFILIGRMGTLKYFVQLHNSDWRFNGLRDNAYEFESHEAANRYSIMLNFLPLPLEIMPA